MSNDQIVFLFWVNTAMCAVMAFEIYLLKKKVKVLASMLVSIGEFLARQIELSKEKGK